MAIRKSPPQFKPKSDCSSSSVQPLSGRSTFDIHRVALMLLFVGGANHGWQARPSLSGTCNDDHPDEHRRPRVVRDAGGGAGSSGRRGAQRGAERHHPEASARRAHLFRLPMRAAGTRTARSSHWGGPQVAFILDLAKEMANRLTADRNGKAVHPKWSVMAWANVNGPGDGNICHYHPGAFWSGTYYVADGGCAADHRVWAASSKCSIPAGPDPECTRRALKFMGEDGQSVGAAETIRPRPGLLFLFPSWLFHQVRPYRGDSLRISIAFNLSV